MVQNLKEQMFIFLQKLSYNYLRFIYKTMYASKNSCIYS